MLTRECIESGAKQFSNQVVQARFRDYCKCSGEKIAEQFTKDEFMKMKERQDEAEMRAKLLPIIQPCIVEMEEKIGSMDTVRK